MKKLLLTISAILVTLSAFAFPKAFYVKKGDTFLKYNFGVAGDLQFSKDGKTLTVTGYDQAILLDEIDYITFTAPVDANALTPTAQKEKLVAVGEEVNSMVDMSLHADMIRLIDSFVREYDRDPDGEYGYHSAPAGFYIDPKYWDVHNAFTDLVEGAEQAIKLNAAGSRSMRTAAVDLYKLSDYFGIFYADRQKEEWIRKGDADYLEIQFTSIDGKDNYAVRLEGTTEGTGWLTPDVEILFPNRMDITFSANGKTICTSTISTTLVQEQSIDMALNLSSNGIVVNNKLHITNDSIKDNVLVTIGGKHLTTVKSELLGRNLLKYDVMHDALIKATHHHDENGKCIDGDISALYPHFIRAKADVDIIGKLQIKSNFSGLSKVAPRLMAETDIYDYIYKNSNEIYTTGKILSDKDGQIVVTHESVDTVQAGIDVLNDYFDASFYYDNDNKLQGYLTWDIYEDSWESYSYDPEYPDDTDYFGYIIMDGHLVRVRHDYDMVYNEEKGEWENKWKDWTYDVSVYNPETESYDYESIAVNADDVIHPETVTEMSYEARPLLTFPDQTSFAINIFFDKLSFKKLIDDVNEIVDSYFSITGAAR